MQKRPRLPHHVRHEMWDCPVPKHSGKMLVMFDPDVYGYPFQAFDPNRVRALARSLADSNTRPEVREFSERLVREVCTHCPPTLTERTFAQLARWCKTAGSYERGMGFAQQISLELFGRILQRNEIRGAA
jgi:hypothetical protein